MARPLAATREPLTRNDLAVLAPSVFAEAPVSNVSSRYCFVPTVKVVEALEKKDWLPVAASQTKSRTEDGIPYKRHLVRFGNENIPAVNGVLPEIVLINSHDTTSSFYLMGGLFRLACLNGLLIYDEVFSVFIIRHMGYKDQEVIEAEARLVDEIPLVTQRISDFQKTDLTPQEKVDFAFSAASMRWGEKMPNIDPLELLTPKREEDRNNTLWSTYNTVQENLFKGGISGTARQGVRKITTREIKSVGENVRINKFLWQLAEKVRVDKNNGVGGSIVVSDRIV